MNQEPKKRVNLANYVPTLAFAILFLIIGIVVLNYAKDAVPCIVSGGHYDHFVNNSLTEYCSSQGQCINETNYNTYWLCVYPVNTTSQRKN